MIAVNVQRKSNSDLVSSASLEEHFLNAFYVFEKYILRICAPWRLSMELVAPSVLVPTMHQPLFRLSYDMLFESLRAILIMLP